MSSFSSSGGWLDTLDETVGAANSFYDSLQRSPAEVRYASRALERASTARDAQTERSRFTAGSGSTLSGATPEDLVNIAAAQTGIGMLLIAAGQAAGESGQVPNLEVLKSAIANARSYAHGWRADLSVRQSGYTASPEKFAKTDPSEALSDLKHEAHRYLDNIVDSSNDVVSSVMNAIGNGVDALSDAVSAFSSLSSLVEKYEGLIRKGIEAIRSALQSLKTLADKIPSVEFAAIIKKLRTAVSVRKALRLIYGVSKTEALIDGLSIGPSAERINAKSGELETLAKGFVNISRSMKSVLNVISLVAGTLTLFADPATKLLPLAAYAIVVGTTISLGMDYADSGGLFQTVPGIRLILQGFAGQEAGSGS